MPWYVCGLIALIIYIVLLPFAIGLTRGAAILNARIKEANHEPDEHEQGLPL